MFTIAVHLLEGWKCVGNFLDKDAAIEALAAMYTDGNYAGLEMHVVELGV